MPEQTNKFYCRVNFYRYDMEGNRIGFSRKNKTCLEVIKLKVVKGLMNDTEIGTLYFGDGTYVGPFPFSKWNPKGNAATVASNYAKWLYGRKKEASNA